MDLTFSRFEILTGAGALFLGLLFVALFTESGPFQASLGAAARQALATEPLFWHAIEPKGRHLVLRGAAADADMRQRAEALAAAVPGVARVSNKITVVGPEGACQGPVDAVLRASPVMFRPGQVELLDSSHRVLDAVAQALLRCNARFEVASHTDSRGDSAVNRALTQRRADLVMRYLVRAGVPEARLRAVGYGESQPVADNASEAGRAANRRLELRVIGSAE